MEGDPASEGKRREQVADSRPEKINREQHAHAVGCDKPEKAMLPDAVSDGGPSCDMLGWKGLGRVAHDRRFNLLFRELAVAHANPAMTGFGEAAFVGREDDSDVVLFGQRAQE